MHITNSYIQSRTNIPMHNSVIHLYVYICMQKCTHIHTRTDPHTHTHTHTKSHAQMLIHSRKQSHKIVLRMYKYDMIYMPCMHIFCLQHNYVRLCLMLFIKIILKHTKIYSNIGLSIVIIRNIGLSIVIIL